MVYGNGDIYEGLWRDGQPNGNGLYLHADGVLIREGEFKDGLLLGRGVVVGCNGPGSVYQGELQKDRKHGYGSWTICPEQGTTALTTNPVLPDILPPEAKTDLRMKRREANLLPAVLPPIGPSKPPKNFFHERCFYEGYFLNDLCSGKGKMIYKTGAVYEGGWRKGKWSGTGRLQYSATHVFEGEFHDGERKDGKGKLKTVEGDYEGDFVNLKKEGSGCFVNGFGDVYVGEFADDNYSGKGKMIYKAGGVYEGEWRDGDKNGSSLACVVIYSVT